jgi:hypothetical protein
MNRDPRLQNKWWRLTHLYKILNKRGELITFKPNAVQLMILMALGRRLRARILKYRQGGVTTLFCILYLDDALWTPGFSAAIIAHDRSTLDKIFMIVKRAYDNLPDSIKPYTRQDTLRSYRFEKAFDGQPLDSSIYVDMKIRGTTAQALHISERPKIEGEKSLELESGSKEAVPMFGRITEEGTANGYNEWFDAYTEDYNNPNPTPLDYLALFYAWHEDPQYKLAGAEFERTEADHALDKLVFDNYGYHLDDDQIRWYNWKEGELIKAARESDDKVGLTGRQLMKQEYPSTMLEAFQSGQGNVFDSAILQTYTPAPFKEIIDSKSVPGQKIKIIHSPVKAGDKYTDEEGNEQKYTADRFYGVGCDPSDGTGDPAGIAVWDEHHVKVAEWHGLLRPDKLAELVKEMAEMYNRAFAGVENNMLSTILFLSKIYNNYYSTVTVDERRQRRTKKMGWTTTGKSRDVMIDDFVMHFEEETLRDLTAQSLKEMQTFVITESGKREHAVGKHDDMLFADMIAVQMVKHKKESKTQERVYAEKPAGF